MARSKRTPPPGSRVTSSGRITITIPCEVDGKRVRLSQNKILPSEPKSYPDADAAWEGYNRVQEFLVQRVEHGQTLAGFWTKWTDPDHHWNAKRTGTTVIAYAARTKLFVERYGNRPMVALTEQHLDEYLENGGILSHVAAISRMYHDAKRRKLVAENPFAEAAREATKVISARAEDRREMSPPPKTDQIEAMLARFADPVFPASLLGWFTCATGTGMRGGEVDGMQWEFLHGNRYEIRRQWCAKERRLRACKHGSSRDLLLSPRIMREIEKMRGNGSKYIWTDSNRDCWTHNTRDYWWMWSRDGKPSPRQLVGGATIYNATRHYWASWAVNEMGITPYQASLLYGHSDGGALITKVYCHGDHERAMRAALDAANVFDLNSRRRDDDAGATVAA